MLILCSNHLTVKAAVCLASLFQVMSADIPNCFINMYMIFMAKLSLTDSLYDQIQFSCLTCIFHLYISSFLYSFSICLTVLLHSAIFCTTCGLEGKKEQERFFFFSLSISHQGKVRDSEGGVGIL